MPRRWTGLVFAIAAALSASTITVASPAHAVGTNRVSVGGGAVVEGQMTHRYIKFMVTLSYKDTATISVPYSTVDGSATVAGVDYKAKSGTLVFTPGQTSKGIAVVVWPDRDDEEDQTFSLVLGTPVNASAGQLTATGTIIDDDPNVGPKVAIGDGEITEKCSGTPARAVAVVTLSVQQSSPVVVQVTTVDDTATAGVDYTAYNKVITFSASQSLKEVKVPVLSDTVPEGDKTLSLQLTYVSGPVPVSRSVGTITIHDCDPS